MSADPYSILGVKKTATDQEIKKAYRKIARDSHPDLKPDDPTAEDRFKAASAAFDLLKDPETRARYDRGEIDATGAETPQRRYYRDATGAGDGYSHADFGGGYHRADQPDIDPEDLFAHFARAGGFGQRQGRSSHGDQGFDMPGHDHRYALSVPFLTAARGGKTHITLPGGDDLAVTIPEGATDGMTLRLRGKGGPGYGRGPAGDAYVTIHVEDHPVFKREGTNVRVTLDISIDEAVLGAKVPVETIDGRVNVSVPPGASSGQVLRLRGRGVKTRGKDSRGDQLVELRIVMPGKVDAELTQFMEEWRKTHAYDPRQPGRKTR